MTEIVQARISDVWGWENELKWWCYPGICPQIRETRRTVRDSDSGLEQMSIGHHIRERAHIMQRSRNHRTGDQEERQDYINMDESEYCLCAAPSKPRYRFPTTSPPELHFSLHRWCSRIWRWVEAGDIPLPGTAGAGLPAARRRQRPSGWRDSSCNPGPWGFSLQTVPSIWLVNPEQTLWGVRCGHPQIYLHTLVSLHTFLSSSTAWLLLSHVIIFAYGTGLWNVGWKCVFPLNLESSGTCEFWEMTYERDGGSCLSYFAISKKMWCCP